MGKTLEESQQELEKSLGLDDEDPTDDDAIEELNRKGRKVLKGKADTGADDDPDDADKESEGTETEDDAVDDTTDDEDEDTNKSLDDITETDYLDEKEVYGRIVKSASGDLSMLINGAEVVDELVKAFASEVGDTNRSVAAATVLVKAIQHNQLLQNNALVAMGKRLDSIIAYQDGQPVRKASNGTLYGRETKVAKRPGSDSTIDKSMGLDAPVDKFGGIGAEELSSLVKKCFDDPKIREKCGINPEHLSVRKSGLTRLPKELIEHLIETEQINLSE